MKKQQLLDECLLVLDLIQETIEEILTLEDAHINTKWKVINNAIEVVYQYEHLAPEVQDAFVEMHERVKDGSITIEEAFEMVSSVETKPKKAVDNKKKTALH